MRSVADNAYVAYRSLRGRLKETLWPPDLDPLCAVLLRKIWLNGSSIGIAYLRMELALLRSTMSTALRRLEDRGYARRRPNVIDARYVDVALTRAGRVVAPAVSDLLFQIDADVDTAAGGHAIHGFDRVATMLAVMGDDEGTGV